MKIIKYPKIPIQQCKNCKALIEIRFKDLKTDGWSCAKEIWKCKLCKYANHVKFEEVQDESICNKE